jgi:hypothetical protein
MINPPVPMDATRRPRCPLPTDEMHQMIHKLSALHSASGPDSIDRQNPSQSEILDLHKDSSESEDHTSNEDQELARRAKLNQEIFEDQLVTEKSVPGIHLAATSTGSSGGNKRKPEADEDSDEDSLSSDGWVSPVGWESTTSESNSISYAGGSSKDSSDDDAVEKIIAPEEDEDKYMESSETEYSCSYGKSKSDDDSQLDSDFESGFSESSDDS